MFLFEKPIVSVWGKKAFSSTLLGSVTGALQIKLSKDRLTGDKCLFHMHIEGLTELK